jgi:hypothetical protein
VPPVEDSTSRRIGPTGTVSLLGLSQKMRDDVGKTYRYMNYSILTTNNVQDIRHPNGKAEPMKCCRQYGFKNLGKKLRQSPCFDLMDLDFVVAYFITHFFLDGQEASLIISQ